MYKHKLLAHPEEEVTFTMRIQRRHQGPLSRQVHENVIIGMLEAAGTSLNSKVGGYNRSSMPRLSVVVNNKLHEPQPQEAAVEDPELDVEGIFNNNNRRKKKKSRDKSDHDSELVSAPISLHLPPPKRRKIIRTKLCTSEDIPEEELGPGQAGIDRNGPVTSESKQKQASSSVPLFPIFKSNFNSDIRLEQGGTKKTKAKSKRNPAKFQLNTIKNHFITKAPWRIRHTNPKIENQIFLEFNFLPPKYC